MAAEARSEGVERPPRANQGPSQTILVALVRRLRLIVLSAVVGAILFLVLGLLLPKKYTAKASFIPDAGQSAGLLTGLVGQFVGLQTDRLIPRLAGDLAESDPLLTQVLYEHFGVNSRGDSARLREYLVTDGADSAMTELRALKRLKKDVAVDVNERTGVVDVYATFHDPVLASNVANRIVEFVDRFNTRTRQSRAGALRRFLEDRVGTAQTELSTAEGSLQHFYTVNRRFQESPRLVLDEARLRRLVDFRQQVYVSLSQQLEQARVDEVKDTPVLTWVGIATPPARKSSPRLSIMLVTGLLLGGGIVVLWIGVLAYMSWFRHIDPDGFGELRAATQTALGFARRTDVVR